MSEPCIHEDDAMKLFTKTRADGVYLNEWNMGIRVAVVYCMTKKEEELLVSLLVENNVSPKRALKAMKCTPVRDGLIGSFVEFRFDQEHTSKKALRSIISKAKKAARA